MGRNCKIFILIAASFLLGSCSISKRIPVIQRDSTVINIRDSVILRDSIVYVEMPKEESKAAVPGDDSSHIETSIAESDAWLSDGQLHHTLRNKRIQIPTPVVVKDHLITENREHIRVVYQEVKVEKELPWHKKFLIGMGKLSLLVVLFFILKFAYLRR